MAYIESHQELGRHPKTKRLARQLGISIPAAVGHLQFLWWWAMDYAQDGDLSRYDSDDIADAAMWDGAEAATFVEALAAAGFLDGDGECWSIHDWADYGGKLLVRKRRNAERMVEARAEPVPLPAIPSYDTPADVCDARATHAPDTCVVSVGLEESREEKKRVGGTCADAHSPPPPLRAPKARGLTDADLDQLQEEWPHVDVRSAAADYLNWKGSAAHVDKVRGLRNQLRSPQSALRHPRAGPPRASPAAAELPIVVVPPRLETPG